MDPLSFKPSWLLLLFAHPKFEVLEKQDNHWRIGFTDGYGAAHVRLERAVQIALEYTGRPVPPLPVPSGDGTVF